MAWIKRSLESNRKTLQQQCDYEEDFQNALLAEEWVCAVYFPRECVLLLTLECSSSRYYCCSNREMSRFSHKQDIIGEHGQ